jgi:hypothetical protein
MNYDDDSRPVPTVEFDWTKVEESLGLPLEDKFQLPAKTQAALEFARRISVWLGGAKNKNGLASRALALIVCLGGRNSDAHLRPIARHWKFEEANFRKEIVRCKEFMAGMEVYHLRGENENVPNIQEAELKDKERNECNRLIEDYEKYGILPACYPIKENRDDVKRRGSEATNEFDDESRELSE